MIPDRSADIVRTEPLDLDRESADREWLMVWFEAEAYFRELRCG